MLLLPLLIWWARKPMHFSGQLLGTINTMLTFTAVVIPLCADRSVHAADRTGTMHNELRSQHQLISTSENVSDVRLRGKKFREGTLVPPTTGRLAPSGRRWVFIPDDATGANDTVAVNHPAHTFDRRLASIPVNPLRQQMRDASQPDDTARRQQAVPTFQLANHALSGDPNEKVNPIGIPQLIAVENMMLQRIVEAIRVDGSDNRWTITAQITEFFDENRLQILTAERAPAN